MSVYTYIYNIYKRGLGWVGLDWIGLDWIGYIGFFFKQKRKPLLTKKTNPTSGPGPNKVNRGFWGVSFWSPGVPLKTGLR